MQGHISMGDRSGRDTVETQKSVERVVHASMVLTHATTVPRSHFNSSRSCFDGPRSRFDSPRSRFDSPRWHFNGPRSRFDDPSLQIDGPHSQLDSPRSAFHLVCHTRQGVVNTMLCVSTSYLYKPEMNNTNTARYYSVTGKSSVEEHHAKQA